MSGRRSQIKPLGPASQFADKVILSAIPLELSAHAESAWRLAWALRERAEGRLTVSPLKALAAPEEALRANPVRPSDAALPSTYSTYCLQATVRTLVLSGHFDGWRRTLKSTRKTMERE